MNNSNIIKTLLCLVLISTTLTGHQIDLSGLQPGVVDLTVVTALHPLMSLYDFNRMGFLNIEFGLDAKSLHERRKKLMEIDDATKMALEKEQENLNGSYSELKQKQFLLMNEIRETRDENKVLKLRKQADVYQQRILELFQKRNLVTFRLANPDLVLPERTKEMMQQIEKEVLDAVKQVANREGFSLILNAAIPNNNHRNPQRSFEILIEKNLSLAETDLYYAFLANTPETAQQIQEREHMQAGISTQNGAARWLEQSRQPGIQEQLPINPHPLVLKGGIDITSEVVKLLLVRYKCDEQVINKLETLLKNRQNRQEK